MKKILSDIGMFIGIGLLIPLAPLTFFMKKSEGSGFGPAFADAMVGHVGKIVLPVEIVLLVTLTPFFWGYAPLVTYGTIVVAWWVMLGVDLLRKRFA